MTRWLAGWLVGWVAGWVSGQAGRWLVDWWLGSWLSGRQEGSEDRASRPQRLRNPGQGIAVLRSVVREISAVSGMTLMARNRQPSFFSFWKPLA